MKKYINMNMHIVPMFSRVFYSSFSRLKGREDNRRKVWIDFNIFYNEDIDRFKKFLYLTAKLEKGVVYNILLKLRKNDTYYMIADKQKCFCFKDLDDVAFEKLFFVIIGFLNKTLDEYNNELDGSCDSVLMDFWPVDVKDDIKKLVDLEVLKDVEISKKGVSDIKKDFKIFGGNDYNKDIKLNVIYGKNINEGVSIKDIEDISYLHNINKDLFINGFNLEQLNDSKDNYYLDMTDEVFLSSSHNKDIFLIINTKKDGDVIIRNKKSYNKYGVFLSKVKDIIYTNGDIRREFGNRIVYLDKDNNIIRVEKNIRFGSIKSDYRKKNINKDWLPNSNIGVFDIETYENNGIGQCFALGYYSSKDDKPTTFYINNDLNSVELVHKCLNGMLNSKYKDIIFYCHNLGGFDSAYIIKNITLYNETEEGELNPYIIDSNKCVIRNGNIIKLVIKRRIKNIIMLKGKECEVWKMQTINLVDSLPILLKSLRSLAKDFNSKYGKTYFPYEFCSKDTLFYIGRTPDIKYYKDLVNDQNFEIYNTLYKEDWSLKDECLKYLEYDLLTLYDVITQVNKGFHLSFKKQMTDNLTISGFASRLFMEDYYDPIKKPLPLIKNRYVWNHIHESYYGGRVEVFVPIHNKGVGYYYDVNSLYPYCSLNPLPGLNWVYFENIIYKKDLSTLFGFLYCKVTVKDQKIGLLPHRLENGSLVYPNGTWYGWYFSEEIKFAMVHGVEVEILKGYSCDKSYNVFTDYVKDIYKKKSNPKNPTERALAKLIINSGIGRFGMDYLKNVTKVLNYEQHNYISVSRKLSNSIEIGNNVYIDSFTPYIDKSVCEEFNVDFSKILNLEEVDEKSGGNYNGVSISTVSAVVSYARIHMLKLKLDILNKGGVIYYTDTDSIVTDLKLSDELISSNELGKLKLEHEIVEGYFLNDKTYAIKNIKGEIIKKAKSINSQRLDFDDYIKMYNGEEIFNTIQTSSNRNYQLGSVTIKDAYIKLNIQCYSKRIKIYNENNKWIDTKPLFISQEKHDGKVLDNNKDNNLYTIKDQVDKLENSALILYKNNLSLIPYSKDYIFNKLRVLPSVNKKTNIKLFSLFKFCNILKHVITLIVCIPFIIYYSGIIDVNNVINTDYGVIVENSKLNTIQIIENYKIKESTLWGIFDFKVVDKSINYYTIHKYNNYNSFNNYNNNKVNILDYIITFKNEFKKVSNYIPNDINFKAEFISNNDGFTSVDKVNIARPTTPLSNSNIMNPVTPPSSPNIPMEELSKTLEEVNNRKLAFYTNIQSQISKTERILDSLFEKRNIFIDINTNSPITPGDSTSKVTKISIDLDLKNYEFELYNIKSKFELMSPSRANKESNLLIGLNNNINILNSKMYKTNILLDSIRIGLNK